LHISFSSCTIAHVMCFDFAPQLPWECFLHHNATHDQIKMHPF
jgi:hypothetical protein